MWSVTNPRENLVIDAYEGTRPSEAHCEECSETFRTSSALTSYQAIRQIRADFDAHACKSQNARSTLLDCQK